MWIVHGDALLVRTLRIRTAVETRQHVALLAVCCSPVAARGPTHYVKRPFSLSPFEFSLRLSRACLDKPSCFIKKLRTVEEGRGMFLKSNLTCPAPSTRQGRRQVRTVGLKAVTCCPEQPPPPPPQRWPPAGGRARPPARGSGRTLRGTPQ